LVGTKKILSLQPAAKTKTKFKSYFFILNFNMMRRLLIFTSLLFFSITGFAVNHSGTINTETWYKSDNPHIITGDITVSTDTTLTIEPGCIIKFNAGRKILINGVFVANGTQTDTILFTSNQGSPSSGDWKSLVFKGGQAGSVLNYCKIEYGGSNNAAIWIIDSSEPPTISHCFINESATSGIDIGRKNNKEQLAYISDCKITNCVDYPIYAFAVNTCSLVTGSMSFSGNGYDAIFMGSGHVTLSGTWHNTGYPFIIETSVIIDTTYTITIEPGTVLKFFNGHNVQLFVYGTLLANGTSSEHIVFTSVDPSSGHWGCFAIWDIPSGSSLKYCDVLYGGSRWVGSVYKTDYAGAVSISNCPDGYLELSHLTIQYSDTSGLYVHGDAFPTVKNCIITNNKVGMLLASNGVPKFGTKALEWNDIYNNGGVNIRLDNNFTGTTPQTDVDAKYVYWGTTDCGTIGNSILDLLESKTNAIVYYNPWLDAGHNVVSDTSDTWNGNTDSDWNTGSNWNGGVVPCYMMDVTIPGSATNFPDITSNESCRNLTLEPAAKMTVESSGDFNVYGDFEMQANSSGDIASLVNYGSFSVRNNSNIENYISSGRWHYISSPLSDDTAGVFMDMYLYSFDESVYDTNAAGNVVAGWVNITDEASSLIPGTGYKVWSYASNPGNKIISFTGGTPNDGTVDLPVSATDRNGNGTIEGIEGWNLVGNPFPSAIDWDNSGWTGKARFDASIYVYDGSQYLSWNGSTGSLTDGVIPAMQAFFVHATNTSPLLKVNNNARVSGPSTYKNSAINDRLRIDVTGNGYSDATFIVFNEDATQGFDSRYDAYKLKGIAAAPQLYSVDGDDILSINVLPGISSDFSIPLGFEVGAETEYTLSFDVTDNFVGNKDIYLEDTKENTIVNILEQNDYTFIATPFDETQRFVLHFIGIQGEDDLLDNTSLKIYSYDGSLLLKSNSDKFIDADVTIYNISGQTIARQPVNFKGVKKISLNVNAGFYIIHVQADSKIYNQQVIIGM